MMPSYSLSVFASFLLCFLPFLRLALMLVVEYFRVCRSILCELVRERLELAFGFCVRPSVFELQIQSILMFLFSLLLYELAVDSGVFLEMLTEDSPLLLFDLLKLALDLLLHFILL